MARVLESIQKAFAKPDPKELVRKWQAELRAQQRQIDRQIRGALRVVAARWRCAARGARRRRGLSLRMRLLR